MQTIPTYVMVMRDEIYCLVGPFASHDAAGEWFRDKANYPSEDPRWQTINLADPEAQPAVVKPGAARRLFQAETGVLPPAPEAA